MRKILLITVRMARWKRQVKDILGWLDSRSKISETSVTGSSATCPVSLNTARITIEVLIPLQKCCSQNWPILPDPNILSGSDDPLQWGQNEVFKLLILSLRLHKAPMRGWFQPSGNSLQLVTQGQDMWLHKYSLFWTNMQENVCLAWIIHALCSRSACVWS